MASFWNVRGLGNPRIVQVLTNLVHFLNICSFSPKLNETNIVLILKKTNPELVTDLRPISLCNVIYKSPQRFLQIV